MIEALFDVATEFRFDVGQALLNTNSLKQAVDGLSDSAGGALNKLNFLASGLVARLGLGSGGLLSVLSKAVQVSEDLDRTSLGFSNTIQTNMATLSGTIGTFNERLAVSQKILTNISDTAIKFAIPTNELAQMTQLLATPLANRKKLGTNFAGSIEMSKNLILGAGTVGINPQVAGESLYRALTDKMPLHGALFSRLANTAAFKGAHVATQSQLQMMNPDKKMDLLDKALKSVAGDTDALNYRLNSLHGQFTILQNLFTSIGSVLSPIGEAIKKPLVKILGYINTYIAQNGKKISDSISKLLGNLFDDPKKLFINLMQLKAFGADFKKSLHMVELYGMFKFLKYIFAELLGISFNGALLKTGLVKIVEGLKWFFTIVPWMKILSYTFNMLRVAMLEVMPIFIFFLWIFQTLSRAKAIAKLNDWSELFTMTPQFAEMLVRLKRAVEMVILPFSMTVDYFAELIAPLFETSTLLKILVPIMGVFIRMIEAIGNVVVNTLALIQGIIEAFIGFALDMINLKNPFSSVLDNYLDGYRTFLKDTENRLGRDNSKTVAGNVTNIGNQNIRFDMREQLEPDRIAFAVTEKLKQLASNPRQGRGNSFHTIASGSLPFAVGGD